MSSVRTQLLYIPVVFSLACIPILGYADPAATQYHIYSGNTHSHTAYTWSHGAQYSRNGCAGILVYGPEAPSTFVSTWTHGYVKSKNGCAGIYVINSLQYPSPGVTLRPDWRKHQGPPSSHFELAKTNGYDFYVTTDHSQEAGLQPRSPEWADTKRQAADASNRDFVAIAGFEYSENDGPGGVGHINVINSANLINALAPGLDLPYLYKWLKTVSSNGDGPVVASFNHPGPEQYNNWAYRDPQVTNIITMLEVINSNNKIHYAGFVNALDHGWKVAPVCGNDNHGLDGITRDTSRTFVLARQKTKAAILDAMEHRRTYASLDKNIQCIYTVNGAIMGSTLNSPETFSFNIAVQDPDTRNPNDKITKIDIVKDGGAVVQTYTPTSDYSVKWNPTITDSTSKFFFIRVWNAGGGDAPKADPANPVAWLAPVWTGR